MRLKSFAFGPLLIALAIAPVSSIALDTLAPAIVHAQVDPLAEAERLIEEGNVLDAISEWSQALEKYQEALSLFRQGGDSPEERLRQRAIEFIGVEMGAWDKYRNL